MIINLKLIGQYNLFVQISKRHLEDAFWTFCVIYRKSLLINLITDSDKYIFCLLEDCERFKAFCFK